MGCEFPDVLASEAMAEKDKYKSLEFEVFGRVHGVFFRKYTVQRAKELGLRGWCKNTQRSTVQGVVEGEESRVEQMKYWLTHTGSPLSSIQDCQFRNEKKIESFSLEGFQIKH